MATHRLDKGYEVPSNIPEQIAALKKERDKIPLKHRRDAHREYLSRRKRTIVSTKTS